MGLFVPPVEVEVEALNILSSVVAGKVAGISVAAVVVAVFAAAYSLQHPQFRIRLQSAQEDLAPRLEIPAHRVEAAPLTASHRKAVGAALPQL